MQLLVSAESPRLRRISSSPLRQISSTPSNTLIALILHDRTNTQVRGRGVEVKPGKPQPYYPQNEQGKLHVTQATLGSGSGKEKSVIQCSIGDKAPILLCSLLPNKIECCPLNLEFDDEDESVEFSVTGDRSIHLSGYFEVYDEEYEQDDEEDDSDGIEFGESESFSNQLHLYPFFSQKWKVCKLRKADWMNL